MGVVGVETAVVRGVVDFELSRYLCALEILEAAPSSPDLMPLSSSTALDSGPWRPS